MQAIHRSGHSFAPGDTQVAITPMLHSWLVDAGFEGVKERAHVLTFSTGAQAHEPVCRNVLTLLDLLRSPVIELGLTSEEEWCAPSHEATIDSLEATFRALWFLLISVGPDASDRDLRQE